ncbi:MAG: putative sensor with domain [Deltaproteobacteria bacterium]|nr:putative sensor with domain [Deltaproteobacteria bacterium]
METSSRTNQELLQEISLLKQRIKDLEQSVLEHHGPLAKVKTLNGFLPICASCKKIRDDKGYWEQLEGYITKHSEARFSHGICPECAEQLYPQLSRKQNSWQGPKPILSSLCHQFQK